MTKEVAQGLVVGVFGLMGTLVPAAVAWSRERDVSSARVRRLEEATKRVVFWDQWLKLSTQLPTVCAPEITDRVRNELTMLCAMIESDSFVAHAVASTQQAQTNQFTEKIHTMSIWRKVLLLYKPERSLAYFPRFMFFLGIFTTTLVIVVQASTQGDKEGFYIILFLLVAWILIFRYLSSWLEQPHGAMLLPRTAPPPPPKMP